jgi:hypothetical protein
LTDPSERLWRLRKDSTWIDARVRQHAGSTDVELQFYYDGMMVFARRWPSRDAAVAEAEEQKREFQRAGWTPHW